MTTESAPPLVVSTVPIEIQRGYEVRRVYVGQVEARQESSLAFEVSGVLGGVYAREGEFVRKGAVLASLDTARFEARSNTLAAALARAVADRDRVEREYRRVSRAYESGAASVAELDDAELLYAAARASEAEAEASLAESSLDIDQSRLLAPFDGIVDQRLMDIGQGVPAGQSVLTLLEAGSPEIRLGLSGRALEAVAVGEPIDVDVNGRVLTGRVDRILSSVDRRSRMVDVFVSLEADLPTVRHGEIARCSIPMRREAVGFWVPTTALAESDRGMWALYRFVADAGSETVGTVVREPVRVIHTREDRSYVAGVFENGQRIVRVGPHRLAPGMRVRLSGPAPGSDGP